MIFKVLQRSQIWRKKRVWPQGRTGIIVSTVAERKQHGRKTEVDVQKVLLLLLHLEWMSEATQSSLTEHCCL